MKKSFYSNGKLLLTGEYLVLDGATALAIPTQFGQSLEVTSSNENVINWRSLDNKGEVWFEEIFRINDLKSKALIENKISKSLSDILQKAKKLNPNFLHGIQGCNVVTHLGFPRDWGLGSSSTLINNIAQWADVDAFTLLNSSFGGSGYDIAAAQNKNPILFRIEDREPIATPITLHWNFMDDLFFVHLNKKQDSKEGISRYRNLEINVEQLSRVSAISHSLLACETLLEFELLLQKHEETISEIIGLPTVKERLFKDYANSIKSLGAWGGDFILAIGNKADQEYFRQRGYNTIVPFSEMILQKNLPE